MESILRDTERIIQNKFNMTVAAQFISNHGYHPHPLGRAFSSVIFKIKKCEGDLLNHAVAVPLDSYILNDLTSLYNIDNKKMIADFLVSSFESALDSHKNQKQELARPKAIEVSPVQQTFIGYKCPNCGGQLKVNNRFEMNCSYCNQTFYTK